MRRYFWLSLSVLLLPHLAAAAQPSAVDKELAAIEKHWKDVLYRNYDAYPKKEAIQIKKHPAGNVERQAENLLVRTAQKTLFFRNFDPNDAGEANFYFLGSVPSLNAVAIDYEGFEWGEIYLINMTTGDKISPPDALSGKVSPDGKRIAFAAFDEGGTGYSRQGVEVYDISNGVLGQKKFRSDEVIGCVDKDGAMMLNHFTWLDDDTLSFNMSDYTVEANKHECILDIK